ncbi:hypothetical protein F4825DRAFT_426464 [Nemania diffusa]|nr:hypothetical protein F4825DRAFT_426464 [Nemania diffusa]
MIRQPLHSAIGRSRAEFSRVTDGIAASLRAFSTAQQLAAVQDGNNEITSRPTGRQRAADAFSDLMDLNNTNTRRPSAPVDNVIRKIDLRSESASLPARSASSTGGPIIIRGGLRGGFRGRGGATGLSFRPGGAPHGGGMMGAGRRGGGRAREGGRGGGEGGRSRRQERGEKDEADAAADEEWSPEVLAMREATEIGSTHQFDPSFSKSDLAGWGPGMAATGSSFGKDETVLRQARILGGGQYFHPLHILRVSDLRMRYYGDDTKGLFFPSEEAKEWSAKTLGVSSFSPVPQETKDAVLQDALLGTYQGPEYADTRDTLGTVRSYVRRDASWNTDSARRIEEKIRSLLPGGNASPANATRGATTGA